MIYREHAPPVALKPWVICFWQITGHSPGLSHRVLPDGCADWVVDLQAVRSGRGEMNFVGPMRAALVVPTAGATDLLGIRLRPGVFGALGLPAQDLLDEIVPSGQLAGPRLSCEELAELPGLPQRSRLLGEALCTWLARHEPRPDALVRQALAAWSGPWDHTLPRVAALARQLRISERALERRFRAHAGYTPAGYRRLVRFRRVLRLHATGIQDWAELAAITGYADQSHLVRDFGALAGLTPTAWALTQKGAAGFLQDGRLSAV